MLLLFRCDQHLSGHSLHCLSNVIIFRDIGIGYFCAYMKKKPIQECIPVGCVLPAAVAICWGEGVCLSACWDTHHSPGCEPGDPPPARPLNLPLGVGLETPWPDPSTSLLGVGLETPQPDLSTSPLGVGLETPPLARPLNLPLGVGLETCKACWDATPPLWTE